MYHSVFIDNKVLRFGELFQKVMYTANDSAVLLLWGKCSLAGVVYLAGSSHPAGSKGSTEEKRHNLPSLKEKG